MRDSLPGRALVPGLTLGFFLPLLTTREPVPYIRLLPWALPLGFAAVLLFLFRLKRLSGHSPLPGTREPASQDAVLRPLVILNLAYTVFLIPVPAIPFFLLAVVIGLVGYRLFAFLGGGGAVRPAGLERAGLFIPFTLCFFLLFQVNIIHDAYQYYCLIVSLFKDFDLNLYNEVYLSNADRFYNPFAAHSARYLGVPALEAPFFAAGHLLALGMRRMGLYHALNGFSLPYLFATSLASTLFGLGALALTYRLLREFFSRGVSLLATVGYWLASPLVFFTFCWNGWPHPFNVFFMALFLLHWRRTLGKKNILDWSVSGIIGGILCLIRPTNGILIIFPLYEIAAQARSEGRGLHRLAGPLLGAAAALGVFSPQLTIWKCTAGRFLTGPYREIGDRFDWFHPDFSGVLFLASQHGLLAWSPLVLPAFLGLFLFYRKDRAFGWLSVIFCLLHLYLYASWSVWWTGIGFSNRFFTELGPFLTLGTAALIDATARKRLVTREFWAGLLAFFCIWNVFLIGEYRAGLVPYGIPDPGRVVEEPLTFIGIVGKHLFDFPRSAGSLLASQWSNENVFPSRLLHHLTFRQYGWAAALLGLFFLLCLAMHPILKALLKNGNGAPSRRLAKALIIVTAMGVLGLHLAIVGAYRRTVPFGYFHRFDAVDVPLNRPSEDVFLYATPSRPVTNIDIISYLVYGHTVRQGTPVAQVSVYDTSERRFDFVLRAGIETAETSYLRPEFIHDIRHTLDATAIVREIGTTAYSRYFYPSLFFAARLQLPIPLVVDKIRFRSLEGVSEVIISDVFMRDF